MYDSLKGQSSTRNEILYTVLACKGVYVGCKECIPIYLGTISWLTFHKDTHLFSASEDGTIGIWEVGTWEYLKTLRGHK